LKNYSNQKDKLNQVAPQIPWWAYQIAKHGIKTGEGSYQVDKGESSTKIANNIPKKEKKELKDRPVNTQE